MRDLWRRRTSAGGWLTRLAVAGTAVSTLAIGGGDPALAEATDGTITVRVVQDHDLDNIRDADDPPMASVDVLITDADGTAIPLVTDAAGVATLAPGDNTLVGGRYRIQVLNPDTGVHSEAQITDGHTEPEFAPAVSFVDVADGSDADISVGYVDYTTLGIDGARIFSAVQPDDVWEPDATGPEVYAADYSLQGGPSAVTTQGTLGSVYGIGLDSDEMNIYAGAYAKRGSLYGPGGPGAIYRVNTASGAWETYATVTDAGTTEHDIGPLMPSPDVTPLHDYAFRTAVGRESLGDVEVTEDHQFLTAVNMNNDSLVVYPVQADPGPAPIQTLPVNVPDGAACASDWAPMALGERAPHLYVGAVCGADLETYVIEYLRAADGTLSPTGNVRQGNVGDTVPRAGEVGASFDVVHADCQLVDWRVWTDALPQTCVDSPGAPSTPQRGGGNQFSIPQPMFADIEFLDDGSMALSFRDRGSDQYGWGIYIGERTNGDPAYAMVIATGDVVMLPDTGAGLDFANPLYNVVDHGAIHDQTTFSGITSVPGSGTIVSNKMDPSNVVMTNGLTAFNIDQADTVTDGSQVAGMIVTSTFGKAMGLADLEALVLESTQQIGNRIWIDTDEDGVQGPAEPPVAGVQVSLWSADGQTLIATTETDANGEYYFDTADGILPETDYQIRLDRDADYLAGGPLAGYEPTDVGAGDDGIDNDGANGATDLPPYVVAADITTPDAGINDHSIDFGFVPSLVSIGDYVWIDADRDGVQDDGEAPVPNAPVRLLDPDGNEVATTTTDANGYYVFTDLPASTEYLVEFPTSVDVDGQAYGLTSPDQGGDDALDSDADPATGRVAVTTPLSGDNSDQPGEADNPTIDAGFVPVVSIGDYVWIDADRDGVQDDGEAPVPNAPVRLLDPDGNEVATTTTDADGYYAFTDLVPSGEYVVEFPTTVDVGGTTLVPTQPNQGDDASDSDADPATGRVPVTAPASGSNSAVPNAADDPTIDAGFVTPSVSVGDYVWVDTDRDGTQDPGEPGIPGVTLVITGPNGNPVRDVFGNPVPPVVTDPDGHYQFADLPAGVPYTVTIDVDASTAALAPYTPTTPGVGDPASDSSTGSATSATLVDDGDHDGSLDFGFVVPEQTPPPTTTPAPPTTTPAPPTTAPDPGTLPVTGGNTWHTMQLAALVLAAGLGLLVYVRRRRQAL